MSEDKLTYEERNEICRRNRCTMASMRIDCKDGEVIFQETGDEHMLLMIVTNSGTSTSVTLRVERPFVESLGQVQYSLRCSWRERTYYGLEALLDASEKEK